MNWIIIYNDNVATEENEFMSCHHEDLSREEDVFHFTLKMFRPQNRVSINFILAAPVRECHACFANPDYHELPPQQQADDGHDG